jgi:hypothetical protein
VRPFFRYLADIEIARHQRIAARLTQVKKPAEHHNARFDSAIYLER